ncbi:GNAT family N-acetyltransferase [Dictyobacter kobayashii]|uniref:Ribosomal-protein-serine acetyltransferase n=1 Tax=Dictyobacter kobayashii TaxID=2014872 RepID=A0A402APV0_9CHLR|nr:GNAT family protein [Dictyobacter kobayashii]GCE21084.1 ribosomal-protein-serine acetyltransferase [Dictyobacter kobayashii]
MDDFTILETSRLRLRRFKDTDLVDFMAYRNDPEVARYQSWEGISEAKARAFLREQQDLLPGVPGIGMQIAIEHKESRALLGDCYFKLDAQEPWQAELGYSLARAYQGQGYATEALTGWLNYAFQTFNLHRVIAITDCENSASVALLERLGLRREGHFIQNIWFKGKWGDEYLYAILREEWLQLSMKQ